MSSSEEWREVVVVFHYNYMALSTTLAVPVHDIPVSDHRGAASGEDALASGREDLGSEMPPQQKS